MSQEGIDESRQRRVEVPFSAGTAPPHLVMPPDATDCHHHIFDPRFPRALGRTGIWATVDDYRKLKQRLGFMRSVVVAPASYGFDNTALLDALAQLKQEARGVVVARAEVDDAQLELWHAAGVRGIRVYLEGPLKLAPAEMTELAHKIAPLGWHLQLLADRNSGLLEANEGVWRTLPCPLVLDHLAHVPQPEGVRHARMSTLKRLLDGGRTWVKLSGVYITSHEGPPHYNDVNEVARALVEAAPDRVLWGTDWPHTLAKEVKPDGAWLADQLSSWVSTAEQIKCILVDNPTRLYWTR
ncbi:hypothetical protein EOS_05660 [Caballeronia mineralivorans PML1(12)]|uniref:Amidohydrolase-related domain-containing protein n=1 Tax=Caballeronia mineralivorans PML1(12) TaxID=908627 RepID=A0A0J1D3C6_9BURK|nr:amidohydrolase family protein [Caballeronia mineralivorans]KLU27176.1 hypothetical protein EOS_05660 [Caballeronia mineralivorans PML1(12)]